MGLEFAPLNIPLKVSFKHASHERSEGSSVWVELARDGFVGLGEGCPRSYVTGETQESAIAWLRLHQSQLEKINTLVDLQEFSNRENESIRKNPAAFCSYELAFLDWLARSKDVSVEQLIGLSYPDKINFQYTAVISDGSQEKFEKTVQKFMFVEFWDYKVKITGDLSQDRARLMWIIENAPETIRKKLRLRIDANNLLTSADEAIKYLSQLKIPLLGVEEPLASKNPEELSRVSQETGYAIILDECLLTIQDVERFSSLPGKWIGNVRVSKNGGVMRSIEVGQRLQDRGMGTILGAQVGETSILTRAAMTVAQALGSQVLAQEGAFGNLLLQEDQVAPSILFGPSGVLDVSLLNEDDETRIGHNGWGLIKKPNIN